MQEIIFAIDCLFRMVVEPRGGFHRGVGLRQDGGALSYSLFAVYEGPDAHSPVLADYFREAFSDGASFGLEGISADLFLPEAEDVLLFDDGPGPAAVLQFSSRECALLEVLLRHERFRQHFVQVPLNQSPGVSVTFGIFRSLPSPVAGEEEVCPRTAGLSFLVRYYGPMPDITAFQDFYTANHPPILGRLPGIRNVFCYLPDKFDCAGLPQSEVMLINEVVFDAVEQLNVALGSDIVGCLKADSARFPPFGHSTHHAMRREILLGDARD